MVSVGFKCRRRKGALKLLCLSEYMKIIAIFYYPLLFYPLLLCNTLQHKVGYVFGALLSFTHFIILLWQKVECSKTLEVRKLSLPSQDVRLQ